MRKMAVLEDIHGLYTFSDTPMVTFCTCLTFATFVLHGLAQNGHEWTMFCDQLQIRGFICIWGWVQNRSWLIPRKLGGKDCWWHPHFGWFHICALVYKSIDRIRTLLVKRLVLIGRIWWNHQMLVALDPHIFAHVKTSPNCPSLQGKLPLFGAGLRTRLWCNASLEFVLPLVALLLATALKIFLHFREKQQAAAPKKGEVKEKELLSWKKKTGQYLIVYTLAQNDLNR